MQIRIVAFAAVLLLAACGLPANVAVLLPEEDGTVGQAIVSTPDSNVPLGAAYAAVGKRTLGSLGSSFVADSSVVRDEFSSALAAAPRKPVVFIAYFISGTTTVSPTSEADLQTAIKAAKTTPNADISVVGHADSTGTDAENQILSLARATVVRGVMVEAGVPASIIELTYHGSNNPRVRRPNGVPEPQNRRVEVTVR